MTKGNIKIVDQRESGIDQLDAEAFQLRMNAVQEIIKKQQDFEHISTVLLVIGRKGELMGVNSLISPSEGIETNLMLSNLVIAMRKTIEQFATPGNEDRLVKQIANAIIKG